MDKKKFISEYEEERCIEFGINLCYKNVPIAKRHEIDSALEKVEVDCYEYYVKKITDLLKTYPHTIKVNKIHNTIRLK